jgi:hypothetical protein
MFYDPISEIKNLSFNSFNFEQNIVYFKEIDNTIKPYDNLPSEDLINKNILDLTGDKKKAITFIDNVFFPFLFQNLSSIVLFYSRIKNRNIKLYICLIKSLIPEEEADWKKLKDFFIKYLVDIKIEFEFLEKTNFDAIKIDNVCILSNHRFPFGIASLGAMARKSVRNPEIVPFRKVFVARKNNLDQRIDNDEEIKDFFKNYEFEIVYPEDFDTFWDQIRYFNECKIIAGISGSGLLNCIFMKPGGTVIELVSVFRPNGSNYPTEIHHYYIVMANIMKHLYFSISNLSEKASSILSNKKALEIIKML